MHRMKKTSSRLVEQEEDYVYSSEISYSGEKGLLDVILLDWRRGVEFTNLEKEIREITWPGKNLPQVIGPTEDVFGALIREYLFVSLYKASAESLAVENVSRLDAMRRAEKNIDEMLDDLNREYNKLRQSNNDSELFDVIAGFEALKK